MGRRFALKTESMKIIINGQELTKESLDFEYREPQNITDWTTEEIPDFGKVQYWFGFLKDTIKDPELRGVSVFARDRVAQFTPFLFNLTGGINGQVGLEYLTGQVKAEEIDGIEDYIATPRQSVNWQFGKAPLLEKWGQEKIKSLCKEWKKRRDKQKLDVFKHDYSEFHERINALVGQEKEDLTLALGKIAMIERIEKDDFTVIANSMISGIERESVKKIIKKINAVSDNALPELFEAIKEWDIISAVSTAEVVVGKIEIIDQFKKHIDERLPEKTQKGSVDMQTFISEHPWLLGHNYEQLTLADFHHERGVDKWIEDNITETNKEFADKDNRENKRFDLLCIKDNIRIIILELMRPGLKADYDHLSRLIRYVTRIQEAVHKSGTETKFQNKIVSGLLIADDSLNDYSMQTSIKNNKNIIDVVEWKALFNSVIAGYKEYVEILRKKAPNDPRIKGLVNLG